jgi:HTH-type transcriptional regulator/antitoxin HigA
MTKDSSVNENDIWGEFLVKNNERLNNRDLFDSYKLFKNRIGQLSRPQLLKLGWLPEGGESSSLTDLFRDIYKEKNNQLFRRSVSLDSALTSAWLSRIKSNAEIIALSNNISDFNGITKSQLKEIAQLSVDEDVVRLLPKILLDYGIVLVYEKCLPGTKIDGVVFTLSSGHPVIGISFRYSRLDYFWFTLLHELSHVNLHFDMLENPILDDFDVESDDQIETSANRLAKFSMVDRSVWRNCKPKYDKSFKSVEEFAMEVGVHKAIIAGLLRRELGDYKLFSKMVNEINVRELVFDDE